MCVQKRERGMRDVRGDEEVGWEMKNRPAEGCECDSEERVVRVGVNR